MWCFSEGEWGRVVIVKGASPLLWRRCQVHHRRKSQFLTHRFGVGVEVGVVEDLRLHCAWIHDHLACICCYLTYI